MFGCRNGVFFFFFVYFGVFRAIFMRKTRTFSHFFPVTSPLREGVKVLGITPHLLNASDEAEATCRR